MFDSKKVQSDFPILQRRMKDKCLVYLDSAATTQKPIQVIDAISEYYKTSNANVHRGVHTLSEEATEQYESTRKYVKNFINAKKNEEIIFTHGTTESINLIAYTWGGKYITQGDRIVVSAIEHHSNLVPWQVLTKEKEAILEVIPFTNDDSLKLDEKVYKEILKKGKVKLVCLSAMSNVLGMIPNVKEMIKQAHDFGALVVIDAAQYAAHRKLDMQEIDADFCAFSSHKMLGPLGVGVLYAKEEILKTMPSFLYGGDMVLSVDQYEATYNELPFRFEAGTPNIADIVAFKTALEYIENIGFQNIKKHDETLLKAAIERFSAYQQVTLFHPRPVENVGGILAFNVKGVHAHDVASIFSEEGVAIRSGHHCAQPLLRRLGVEALARMSFYIYNTLDDIETAQHALNEVIRIFDVR